MTDKTREEYNAWYAKEIGVLGTGQHKAWFRPWLAAREKPFADAVACVFDSLKFAACNTSGKEWSEELEDLAEEVIQFAPQYKRQWKEICKLSARIAELEAQVKKC
jgi:hypothetical protein